MQERDHHHDDEDRRAPHDTVEGDPYGENGARSVLSTAKGRDAYRQIEAGIHSGRYAGGERLKEVELAAELGMSRTPIREAIRQLEQDGIVEVIPNRGATVREWSPAEVEDAYALRAVLEGFCASRAAVRMDAMALAHLDELHSEFERQVAREPVDVDAVIRLNAVFHRAIVLGSGSARAAKVLPQATEVPQGMRRAFWESSPRSRELTLVYHREIVDSIRARDAVRAEAVMRSHIFAVKDFFIEHQRSVRIQRLVHGD